MKRTIIALLAAGALTIPAVAQQQGPRQGSMQSRMQDRDDQRLSPDRDRMQGRSARAGDRDRDRDRMGDRGYRGRDSYGDRDGGRYSSRDYNRGSRYRGEAMGSNRWEGTGSMSSQRGQRSRTAKSRSSGSPMRGGGY